MEKMTSDFTLKTILNFILNYTSQSSQLLAVMPFLGGLAGRLEGADNCSEYYCNETQSCVPNKAVCSAMGALMSMLNGSGFGLPSCDSPHMQWCLWQMKCINKAAACTPPAGIQLPRGFANITGISDALWHKACYGINARLLSPLPSSLFIIPRLIVLILAVTRGLKPVAQQSYLHIGKICLSLPCLHCKIRQALIP